MNGGSWGGRRRGRGEGEGEGGSRTRSAMDWVSSSCFLGCTSLLFLESRFLCGEVAVLVVLPKVEMTWLVGFVVVVVVVAFS